MRILERFALNLELRIMKKLVLIDSNALVHRAFHALPPTLTSPKGVMTNAVYGFTSVLLKMLKDLKLIILPQPTTWPDRLSAIRNLRNIRPTARKPLTNYMPRYL